jgi:diamine N-acetyltransferase
MIEIRNASLKDIPLIQQVAEATWPITFGQILTSDQIRYMLDWMYSKEMLQQQLELDNHTFLLAIDSDTAEVLGFSGFQHQQKEKLTKIHKLYMLPQHQGKGIGQRLIEAIASLACLAGDTGLYLNVNKYNEQAIRFYEYIGFVKIDEEIISIGNGYVMDDYVMEISLSC